MDVLDDGKLFNYNVFAQKGHGLAFTSDLARESIIVYNNSIDLVGWLTYS